MLHRDTIVVFKVDLVLGHAFVVYAEELNNHKRNINA